MFVFRSSEVSNSVGKESLEIQDNGENASIADEFIKCPDQASAEKHLSSSIVIEKTTQKTCERKDSIT